jgi:phage terminase large subunit
VPSCFGSGKDWIAARIGAWWVATGGILVVTSNTFSQLRDVYWRELRKAHAKGGLPGQPTWGTDLRWDLGEGSWAIGRKPDDNDPEGCRASTASGCSSSSTRRTASARSCGRRHAASSSTPRRSVLAIGNPWEPTGPFYEACQSPTGTSSRSRSSTPRTSRVRPCRPRRRPSSSGRSGSTTPKADGLEGTAWWQAKVLGQFPDTASDQVIPLNLVETARANAHTPDAREAAGLDVARFGSDDTALVEGSGNGPELVTVVHGHDTMAVAGLGARFLAGRRGVLAVDEGGVGGGVLDRLREQRLPGNVLGVNAGSGADNDPDDRLVNMRAQLWWTAREALYRGEVSLARLPDDAYARLRSELTAPTYRFTSGGKVQIESKEELKKRGISSPDLADAFCLWLYARSRARRRVSSFGAAA